ncbi:FMN-binding negative transcriptional regulator [Massilia sp. W12]|uniref:FMN-binding negative transcriptional regulator n=1 Tax=Massilia sp. W12 TaxID=3126507 RepID=UPI0030CE74F5
MYTPSHYRSQDPQLFVQLAQAFPLACIVRHTGEGLQADHIPLHCYAQQDGSLILRGHVARANPLWRQAGECLAVFQAEQGYISPNWYASKKIHGKAVPTWNYLVAHVQADLRAIDDPVWLRSFLTELTAHHEAGQEHPWRIEDAPPDYTEKMLRAIVGIELRVRSMELKCKCSQNREPADLHSVIAALEQGAPQQQALAQAMARLAPSA